jgi:hypothetical protein
LNRDADPPRSAADTALDNIPRMRAPAYLL